MTRFARAKGSKASNERVFSEPTPWSEMKNHMLKRKQEVEEEKKRREAEAKRSENYQKFLKERKEENTSQTEWAEFPEDIDSKQNNVSKKSKPIKKQKNKIAVENLKKKATLVLKTETMADEIKSVNGKVKSKKDVRGENNIHAEGEKPKKKKLKIILDNEVTGTEAKDLKTDNLRLKKKNKSKNNRSKQNGIHPEAEEQQNSDNEDDAPVETTSKVEVSEPIIKKVKAKKKTPKKGNKNESKGEKNEGNQKREKIDIDSLPEEAKKKVLKKQEKRRKQLEKKKLKKKQQQEQAEEHKVNNPDKKEETPPHDETKFKKSTEKFNKPKPMNKGPEGKKQPKKQKLENGDFKRRKDLKPDKIFVNGNEVELEYIEGFPVKKEDAENLKKLKKEMISKGLPRSEINRTLKLERRKAEKALAREKKKVCFKCRKFGHNLSDCPMLTNKDELVDTAGAGICFKCGSTEHTSFACRVVHGQNFKFATCFICKEQGHISKQCPDNARGLYPKGGSCRVCGDVTHLKKDCPQYQEQQRKEEVKFQVGSIFDGNLEDLDPGKDTLKTTAKPKIIRFN